MTATSFTARAVGLDGMPCVAWIVSKQLYDPDPFLEEFRDWNGTLYRRSRKRPELLVAFAQEPSEIVVKNRPAIPSDPSTII